MKNNGLNIFNIDENGVLTGLCGTVNIPEGVTKLEGGFTYRCITDYDFITEVNIPASCENIQGRLIRCCNNILTFNVDMGNQHLVSEDGVLYTADKKKLIRYPAGRADEVFRVSDEVEEIDPYAFADAKNMSGIYIGKNCRSIGEHAFADTTHYVWNKNENGAITAGGCEYLGIRKYYISPSVQNIANQIFDGGWSEDGLFYNDIIVGGEVGSVIWEHCNQCNVPFLEVAEEEAEGFLATPYEELLERHKKEGENLIAFEFTDEGFGGKLEGDTLELFVLDSTRKDVTVCNLDIKLPENRYEKVKKLVIGNGICAISRKAFWCYRKLESVIFGADISDINAGAFYEDYNILTLALDEKNEHYKCIDGVIFSADLKTLVLYPSGREDPYYEIPSHVEIVGHHSMMGSRLRCIKFGCNVKKICKEDCYNTYGQHHFYVDPAVTEFGDDFIFGVDGKMRMCTCMWNLVVGGKAGSPIEKYCRETGYNGIHFEVVEDDKLDEWLTPPPDPKYSEEEKLLPF